MRFRERQHREAPGDPIVERWFTSLPARHPSHQVLDRLSHAARTLVAQRAWRAAHLRVRTPLLEKLWEKLGLEGFAAVPALGAALAAAMFLFAATIMQPAADTRESFATQATAASSAVSWEYGADETMAEWLASGHVSNSLTSVNWSDDEDILETEILDLDSRIGVLAEGIDEF